MSTLLAHSFPIATIETYFLKKLCSVQRTVAMKKQKRMVKNSLSGALQAAESPSRMPLPHFIIHPQRQIYNGKKTL